MEKLRAVFALVVFATMCVIPGCKSRTSNEPPAQPGAGPSPQTTAATSAKRIADPCKLLTQAEASAAIGAKLAAGELKKFQGITRCTYSNDKDFEQKLWLDVQTETAVVADPVLFDSFSHGPDAKPVAGIGDQAIWAHSELATFLYILKRGTMVAIGLPRTMATMTSEVEQAAKLVASRM